MISKSGKYNPKYFTGEREWERGAEREGEVNTWYLHHTIYS